MRFVALEPAREAYLGGRLFAVERRCGTDIFVCLVVFVVFSEVFQVQYLVLGLALQKLEIERREGSQVGGGLFKERSEGRTAFGR